MQDGIIGKGNSVQGPGITVNIEPASEMFPKTIEDAKKEATELYSGTDFHEEKLPDGYILTFQSKNNAKTNY